MPTRNDMSLQVGEMPDSNLGPQVLQSGALPMSHHIPIFEVWMWWLIYKINLLWFAGKTSWPRALSSGRADTPRGTVQTQSESKVRTPHLILVCMSYHSGRKKMRQRGEFFRQEVASILLLFLSTLQVRIM